MPYRVRSLTFVSGERVTNLPAIYEGTTPVIKAAIWVDFRGRSIHAAVTNVTAMQSKSPGTAVKVVDEIDVQEQ
jgi:hypothetical protein